MPMTRVSFIPSKDERLTMEVRPLEDLPRKDSIVLLIKESPDSVSGVELFLTQEHVDHLIAILQHTVQEQERGELELITT